MKPKTINDMLHTIELNLKSNYDRNLPNMFKNVYKRILFTKPELQKEYIKQYDNLQQQYFKIIKNYEI